MAVETEKRFLLRSDDWRNKISKTTFIEQGYLSLDPERSVRVRVSDNDEGALTVKGEKHGDSRAEYEYTIPLAEAKRLLNDICIKPLLLKRRHEVRERGRWEVDEYFDENAGLIVAEIEGAKNGSRGHPRWLGNEITDDDRYSNISLVTHPFSRWNREQAEETTFHLKKDEPLPEGLSRMIDEQLGLALSQLTNMKGVEDEPVHEARKALKKVRSLLRLMRKTLGSEFGPSNDELRQAGRKLSDLRDAQALIETVDGLAEKSERQPDCNSLVMLRKLLCTRKEQIAGKMSGGDEISVAIQTLESVRSRIGLWPIANVTHGEFNDAVLTTVRRGRKAFRSARDSGIDELFHDWRKRAKDLRYQLEILDKYWPGVPDGYAGCAKDLEQALGEDHNLAVLKDLSTGELVKKMSTSHSKRLQPLIKNRQEKLRIDADEIGSRLYGERLTSWSDRLDLCWNGASGR